MLDKKINVLQFCDYKADFPGSLIDHFEALTKIAKKNNIKIILSFPAKNSWMDKLEEEGMIVEIIPIKSLLDFYSFKKLITIINKYQINIIHTHFGRKTILFAVLSKLLTLRRLRIIRHWRSTPPAIMNKNFNDQYSFRRAFKNLFGPIFWRTVDKFIDYNFVNAKVILNYLIDNKITKSNKVELLENAINLKRFNYFNTKKLQIKYNYKNGTYRVVIGSFVNFRPEKDIQTLIKIAKLVTEKNKDIIFIFAGDGPLRAEIEKDIENKNLQNNIIFTGYISEIESFIASCDIIILSNYAVGVSNAHREAMAMAKPVITFNPGEVDTLIEDGINGFLVPSNDIQTFIERINTLIKDKKLAKNIGQNALKTIQEKYNIEQWAKQVCSIYKNLQLI